MQRKFYVAKAGKTLGPFEIIDIVRKIHAGELALTDYIYLQEKADWTVIVDFPGVCDLVKNHTSPQLAHKSAAEATTTTGKGPGFGGATVTDIRRESGGETEWFVLKGEDKFGPFSYFELVGMLREKTVFEFDYVWNQRMTSWKRISELENFSPAEIKKVESQSGSVKNVEEIFFRRRHARVNYGGSVIVHDNQQVWKGKGLEVSAGGAGLNMDHGDFQIGQTIYLHFQPGDGVPSFNAVCEVISRRQLTSGAAGKDGNFRYGVKFKQIGKNARKFIFNFARSKAEAHSGLGKKSSAA